MAKSKAKHAAATATKQARPKARRAARARRAVSSDAALQRYNAKRHFDITSEPRGAFERRKSQSALRFVIQQHDATRMHFDFRLELDGVLKSWAVPKGPSLSPSEKRLAVEVEDHPIGYRSFEGIIPEGEYGAGAVIVWDRGTWVPEDDPHAGLKKGHLTFSLAGEKTNGRFQLVRLREDRQANGKPSSKHNWLLIKRSDDFVRSGKQAEITQAMPESVESGRTVAEVAKGKPVKRVASVTTAAGAKLRATKKPAAVTRAVSRAKTAETAKTDETAPRTRRKSSTTAAMPRLDELEPQLATLVDTAPNEPGYRYEVKFDGYRALAALRDGEVTIRSRNRLDWSATFPNIAKALTRLDAQEAIVDGEICALDADGRSSFQTLQNVMGARGHRTQIDDGGLVYYVFDLLWLDGEDLRPLPLSERKQRLAALMKGLKKSPLRYSEDIGGDVRVTLAQACKLGLEGLIAKRADAPYEEGRSRRWLKLKCGKRQEFVIVGYHQASSNRKGFRSLLLGLREGKSLRYCGKVGTGFSETSLADIAKKMKQREVEQPAVDNPPRGASLHWVRPELVCEVSFTEMTRDGALRHPSFEGLREDKPASQVRRERAQSVKQVAAQKENESARTRGRAAPDSASAKQSRGRAKAVAISDAHAKTAPKTAPLQLEGIDISHPDRVMDEKSAATKGDLARYYARVAQAFLRFAKDRPMALVRCPQGAAHQCFFQKNAMPGLGKQVRRGKAAGHGILWIDDAPGLLELVQFSAVEFHGWGAQRPHLNKPDWIVFDLDPDTALPFSRVVEAAHEVRDALRSLKLESFVKTTGGKGLHVVVPIKPQRGWSEVKAFTRTIAETLATQSPQRYVATMSKARRRGKIFIDYLRNGEGATAVLPYSTRARPGMTVAVPVAWKELAKIDPQAYRIDNVEDWFGGRRSDPWKDFESSARELPDLEQL